MMTYSSSNLSPFPPPALPRSRRRSFCRRLALTLLVAGGLAPQAQANPVCSKWRPGHYIRVAGFQGQAVGPTLSHDLKYFKGIEYQFDWRQVEPSKGVYRFGELDKVVRKAAAKKKYVIFMMMDRTFSGGCKKGFVPGYVKTVKSRKHKGFCTAAIWEKQTMDHRIRVLKKILKRYRYDDRVVGLNLPETALAIEAKSVRGFSWNGYQKQLVRSVKELKRAAPNMLVLQGFNFPQENHQPGFMSGLVKSLRSINGSGMSWPDTVPSKFKSWDHYKLAKKNVRRLPIAPHVQTPQIKANQTATIFNFLVNEVGAHIVIWNNWHQDHPNYLRKEVIPVVNRHKGKINKSCPA